MGAGQFLGALVPECLQEIPELNALQKQHKDILVIGVAVMYKKKPGSHRCRADSAY